MKLGLRQTCLTGDSPGKGKTRALGLQPGPHQPRSVLQLALSRPHICSLQILSIHLTI